MAETCECGCRHGTSASPPPVGHEGRPRALMPEDTVAAAALRTPFALLVLQRFGIDACCGGSLALAQAAASAGVPVETLRPGVRSTHGATATSSAAARAGGACPKHCPA